MAYFDLCHKCFDGMEEFSGGGMRNLLQVKPPLECGKWLVEFLRFDYGPWYDVQFSTMEARDKVGVLFLFDNLLELERKPTLCTLVEKPCRRVRPLTRERFQLCPTLQRPGKIILICSTHYRWLLTLMMMTSVDWKREGFAAGSRTDALDWNDWKSPLISRPNAKLLRKRTYWISETGPC